MYYFHDSAVFRDSNLPVFNAVTYEMTDSRGVRVVENHTTTMAFVGDFFTPIIYKLTGGRHNAMFCFEFNNSNNADLLRYAGH